MNELDLDKTSTAEEYIGSLMSKLEALLKKHFKEEYRQKPLLHHDRISICCPYCGDSAHSASKKRGNIILSGKFAGHFKCFNCEKYVSVTDFFKQNEMELDLADINYIQANKTTFVKKKYDSSTLFDTNLVNDLAFDRELFKQKFNFIEIDNTEAQKYLYNRMQFDKSKFLYNAVTREIAVLNLTDKGNILGCQMKPLVKHSDAKYKHYKLSKLYDMIGYNTDEIPEDIEATSSIFGMYQISLYKPITLFEGPLDSFLFKNSISNAGISKAFVMDIPVRYWFDSDKVGIDKAISFLNKGECVFLWGKFLKAYRFPKRPKWDLNDVLLYAKSKNIKIKSFEEFFSNDS